MEKLVIDRFEGDKAVCQKDDGAMVVIPRSSLPRGAREGSSLRHVGSSYDLSLDDGAARSARIDEKMRKAFKD